MKESAGTLLYRQGENGLEVLLVHPSGNYNRHKPWSIPKGQSDADEAHMEITARRETLEETGVVAGELVDLGYIDYTKSKKRVHCFAGPAPVDAAPHCASWEVDEACFVLLERAREILHPEQVVFIYRLVAQLSGVTLSRSLDCLNKYWDLYKKELLSHTELISGCLNAFETHAIKEQVQSLPPDFIDVLKQHFLATPLSIPRPFFIGPGPGSPEELRAIAQEWKERAEILIKLFHEQVD